MITRIEVRRYRCFEGLEVEPGPYNVLAGANGSGKTTLLDVPILLGDLLNARVVSTAFLESHRSGAPPRAHTLREIVHRDEGDEFALAIEARLPNQVIETLLESSTDSVRNDPARWPSRVRYEVGFRIYGAVDLQVAREVLWLVPAESQRPGWSAELEGEVPEPRVGQRILHRSGGELAEVRIETEPGSRPQSSHIPPTQLALANVPYDARRYPATVWLQDLLRQECVFYRPDWRQLKQAAPPGLPRKVIANGANLPWLALELAKEDPKRFGGWVDHVREALLNVTSLRIREREEDHHAYFEVGYGNGFRVTSSGLSEGTLRILALTLLPYLHRVPWILVLEEPETAIHPRGLENVLQSLQSLYDTQVWVASQSSQVLAHTRPDQLLCFQIDDEGRSTVVSGNRHPRLQDWQKGLDLGSLFAAGVLD
jgi:predicted ATPase